MKYVMFICITLFLLVSCENEDKGTRSDGGVQIDTNWIESAHGLSFDRQNVIGIQRDTVTLKKSFVIESSILNPSKEILFSDSVIFSATLIGNKLYYLNNQSKISIYDIYADSFLTSPLNITFNKIYAVNDTTIVASAGTSTVVLIYTWNFNYTVLSGASFSSLYNKDTILYLNNLSNNTFELVLYDVASLIPPATFIIDTVVMPSIPLDFSIEPILNRYIISLPVGDGYNVYSYSPLEETYTQVASSIFRHVTLVDSNTILYTGKDGRLYQTDFKGIDSSLYWNTFK